MTKKSKYASQNAVATSSPRIAATITPTPSPTPLAPIPIATSDSPMAMITISPCRSTKCAGCTRQPLAPATQRPEQAHYERGQPEHRLEVAVDEPGRDDQRRAGERPRRAASDRRQQVPVAARSQRVEREIHDIHDQEGDSEHDTFVAERLGDGQRSDEHRRHRNHDRAPDRALIGIDGVRQPGVRRPRPPERAENQEPVPDAGPRRVVREHGRDLREREDEDEVEEELERRDALFSLDVLFAHSRTLTRNQHSLK